MKESFLKKLKRNKGHLLDQIAILGGKTMIYYREFGSYPTDVKTIVL